LEVAIDDTISYNGESPLGRAIGSPSDLAHSIENVCSAKKGPSVSPCPGLPPAMPLPALSKDLGPVFRATLTDDQDREAALNEPDSPCSPLENETKKSFDFTGELNKLNASGEGNRLSFLEQLEMAFPDPAKLQSFDFDRSMLMPSISFKLTAPGGNVSAANMSYGQEQESRKHSHSDSVAQIQHVEPTRFEDVVLPSVVSPPAVLDSTRGSSISPLVMQNASMMGLHPRSSIISRSSDSELSWTFHKDGVKSLAGPMQFSASNGELPLLRKSRSTSSLVEEDSSLLKSIYGHAVPATEEVPPVPVVPRQRLESDTSSKRVARQATNTSHTRTGSEVSFSGFESFSQIRAKFEFMNEQSNYFPEIDLSKKSHSKHESVFSIASVSSYGQVLSGGARDPFNYGYHSRPGSEDLTGSVNDTFSFLKQDPHNKRLSTDSDISGFYFRPGVGQRRGHNRANESVASIYSISGPPVSIYNRSHGQSFGHSRTDSWASGSSLAHAYGSGGANGGRAAWARHVRDQSVQSIEFSAQRLGRPGIGDKMFSSHDPGVPLTAISASPPESAARERYPNGPVRDSVSDGNRISDSIFDEHNKPSADSIFDEHRGSSKDSIFDDSNNRSSASSDSIFGYDQHRLRPQHHRAQFRPISMLSSESSESRKEDDTMLTMFNGDHVRRQSIGSSFEASPCIRMEKHLREVKNAPSPIVKRTLETIPSIQFGEGRMDMARRGLLERQSLEASCLVGDGEEMDRSCTFYLLMIRSH
jgi:serine/arginine repetitive matrix protein 2